MPNRYPCPNRQPSSVSVSRCTIGLDALADRVDAQRARQRQDRAHQCQAFGAGFTIQAGDEAAIDLQCLDREAVQVGQRGEAGAEIVQQRQHAAAAQGVEHAQRARRIVEQRDFGDLDAQPVRIGAGVVDHAQQALGEIVRTEMPWRHVDRQIAFAVAAQEADHALVQQPVDLFDQAAVLADADEFARRQRAVQFMVPAQQAPRGRRSCRRSGERWAGSAG